MPWLQTRSMTLEINTFCSANSEGVTSNEESTTKYKSVFFCVFFIFFMFACFQTEILRQQETKRKKKQK